MNELEIILHQEIAANGVIPFGRFMELCLYAPRVGFYERASNPPGKESHFYTSVSVGRLFGRMLAWKFSRWLETVQSGQICEAGAGQGYFARDLLEWFQIHRPGQFAELNYLILEPSPNLQAVQQRTLNDFSCRVEWISGWKESSEISGIIFANELLDAFPVRRLIWNRMRKSWEEAAVAERGGRFVWTTKPVADSPLDLTGEILDLLPDQFAIDMNPQAQSWWAEAARQLKCGYLVTCDYGEVDPQSIRPTKPEGTLRGFYRHHQVADLLEHPGEVDLTSDVDFAALIRTGEQSGLQTEAIQPQEIFLNHLAGEMMKAEAFDLSAVEKREFQTLSHPAFLGRRFQVLVQKRPGAGDVSSPPRLS